MCSTFEGVIVGAFFLSGGEVHFLEQIKRRAEKLESVEL